MGESDDELSSELIGMDESDDESSIKVMMGEVVFLPIMLKDEVPTRDFSADEDLDSEFSEYEDYEDSKTSW